MKRSFRWLILMQAIALFAFITACQGETVVVVTATPDATPGWQWNGSDPDYQALLDQWGRDVAEAAVGSIQQELAIPVADLRWILENYPEQVGQPTLDALQSAQQLRIDMQYLLDNGVEPEVAMAWLCDEVLTRTNIVSWTNFGPARATAIRQNVGCES